MKQRLSLLSLRTQGLMLPKHYWKHSLQHKNAGWMGMGTIYTQQTNTYLSIFYFIRVERAMKQHLLVELKMQGLMLLACC